MGTCRAVRRKAEEDRLLAADPDLAGAVKRLPAVDEPERLWLTAHATAIAYPTLYEGFGLVPFESAAAGVPTLFASQAALAELLPAELAVLSPWDPEGSAEASLPLLTDPGTRRSHVEAVKRAGRELTWDRTANMLVDCYEALVGRPPREATAGPRARLRLERLLDESKGTAVPRRRDSRSTSPRSARTRSRWSGPRDCSAMLTNVHCSRSPRGRDRAGSSSRCCAASTESRTVSADRPARPVTSIP